MNESLQQHIEKITKLPTIPVIAQRILAMVDDDATSVSALEQIIENDPAISAKILSVANSAFFGFKTPTSTLGNAIVRIGFSSVKNIALGVSLMTVLGNGNSRGVLDYQRIFNHSVSVGLVANLLTKNYSLGNTDEMLMIGMLHDIGFLVLSRYFGETYLRVLNAVQGDTSLLDAEKEVFEFTHCEIGQWLGTKWSLPDTIIDSIRHHHSPASAAANQTCVALVHVSDIMVTKHILGVLKADPGYPFDPASLDMLGLSEENLQEAEDEMRSGDLLNGLFTD